MSVLVLGALHLDVVVDAPALPRLDETVVGSAVAYRFGGKGGNQAVAAARMGARVAMAGAVADDQFGAAILAALDRANVDRSGVAVLPGASGMSVAIVDPAGDYGAVIVSGVNRDIDGAEVLVPQGLRVAVLQNEVPEAANLALLARLPGAVRVILNAAPARALAPELMARTDVLVVNRIEAAMMTGTAPQALDPDAAAGALAAHCGGAVLVTLGAGGLVGRDAGGTFALPGHSVRAVSSHGAGDAFVGALAARLAEDDSLRDAAAFAQGAAAHLVATPPEAREGLTAAGVAEFLAGRR